MAGPLEMAAMSDMLPASGTAPSRIGWRRLLPARLDRSRRPRGLDRIPDRYRLQLLLMASERLPGRPPAEAADLAGRLADRIAIPGRLLAALPRTDELDAWFRDSAETIKASLDGLVA